MSDGPSPSASVKRKRNDPDLQIITLDPHYDLTLIVGTPEHPDGQKAFQVNKGSVRHVSDMWLKMLTGDWAESKMPEIDFPDDSWEPFEIVLKIAHLQINSLPVSLSIDGLQKLATLTDKYNLAKAVRVALDLRLWLHSNKTAWTNWPSSPLIQQFASMALVFQYDSDVDFLTSKLAVEARVEDGLHLCIGSGTNMTRLDPSMSDILLAKIISIRNELLCQLIRWCEIAIAKAAQPYIQCNCKKDQCPIMKAGILVTDLMAAGLFPFPANPKELHSSVSSYWRAVCRVGEKWTKAARPFEWCYLDFGIKNFVRMTLRQRLHADVYEHLQTETFMGSMY